MKEKILQAIKEDLKEAIRNPVFWIMSIFLIYLVYDAIFNQ